jgi:lipoyl(octanoyl) transferase
VNTILHHETKVIDLGIIDYKKAWDFQTELFNSILSIKSENRSLAGSDQKPTPNYLLSCEHPPVYTLGKSGDESNLRIGTNELSGIGATYFHINRGGDITFHGPGQLVVYPILDLENFFTDIHRYMRALEESVIQTLKDYDITAGRIPGLTGVWIDPQDEKAARKICAFGVKTSRWVTMHGLALNVNTDLHYFDHIIPCGIHDKQVTSLEKETGLKLNLSAVKEILKKNLASVFDMTLVN